MYSIERGLCSRKKNVANVEVLTNISQVKPNKGRELEETPSRSTTLYPCSRILSDLDSEKHVLQLKRSIKGLIAYFIKLEVKLIIKLNIRRNQDNWSKINYYWKLKFSLLDPSSPIPSSNSSPQCIFLLLAIRVLFLRLLFLSRSVPALCMLFCSAWLLISLFF